MSEHEKNGEQKRLEVFREEIKSLHSGDQGHISDVPVDEVGPTVTINPESLNLDDMVFWEQIKAKSVTRADVDFYRERLMGSDPDDSRKVFAQLAIKNAMVVIGERDYAARKDELDRRKI